MDKILNDITLDKNGVIGTVKKTDAEIKISFNHGSDDVMKNFRLENQRAVEVFRELREKKPNNILMVMGITYIVLRVK